MPSSPGFADALAGADPNTCVYATAVENLSVITAGDSGIVVEVPGAAGMLKELGQNFEFVVLDLPPAADTNSLGRLLAGSLDGVVLVMECERTGMEAARKAKENLLRENVNILGVVFNKRRRRIPGWLTRNL